jgi:hypothetical protein
MGPPIYRLPRESDGMLKMARIPFNASFKSALAIIVMALVFVLILVLLG